MSSPLSPQQQPSRQWWPRKSSTPSYRSRPESDQLSLRQPAPTTDEKSMMRTASVKQPSSKFNTFASAIGLKSKRHHIMEIQDPPSQLRPLLPSIDPSRPPSQVPRPQTMSTVASWDDSSEPRTPSDRGRRSYQHSIMTLSETDPFAARGMCIPPGPHDPNRLSVHSYPSSTESYSKPCAPMAIPTRLSYASTSSLSHQSNHQRLDPILDMTEPVHSSALASADGSLQSISPRPARVPSKRIHAHDSLNPQSVSPNNSDDFLQPGHITPSSSSVLTEMPNRSRPPSHTERQQYDDGLDLLPIPSQASRSGSTTPVPPSDIQASARGPRPSVVIRQVSTRMPPKPAPLPPTGDLPPTPVESTASPSTDDSSSVVIAIPRAGLSSSSVSSLSFASVGSGQERQRQQPRKSRRPDNEFGFESLLDDKDMAWARDLLHKDDLDPHTPSSSQFYTPAPPPADQLKKSASSHDLRHRARMSSEMNAHTVGVSSNEGAKLVKKQRSFHHGLKSIPLPPLRHASSANIPPLPDEPPQSRKNSVTSPLPRKRLFSGSSHRHDASVASHATEHMDDMRSVFSHISEGDRRQSLSYTNPFPTSTPGEVSPISFWDETNSPESPPPSGIVRPPSPDYIPQHIIPPAELIRLAVAAPPLPRTRSDSFPIASPERPCSGTVIPSKSAKTLSPPAATAMRFVASANDLHDRLGSVPRRSRTTTGPPATAPRTPTRNHSPVRAFTTPARLSTPTSPRKARNSMTSTHSRDDGDRAPSPPMSTPPPSLPPPPRTRRPGTLRQERASFVPIIPLAPPPVRGVQRAATTVTKPVAPRTDQRRSILKKPSFLDIDDELEKERPRVESFLDFGRGKESFDTVRDSEESGF